MSGAQCPAPLGPCLCPLEKSCAELGWPCGWMTHLRTRFSYCPFSRAQLRKADLLGGGGKSEVFQKGSGNSGAEGNDEDNRAVRGDGAGPR